MISCLHAAQQIYESHPHDSPEKMARKHMQQFDECLCISAAQNADFGKVGCRDHAWCVHAAQVAVR